MESPRGVIERYGDYLPITPETPIITLQEGDTPLVPAPRLAIAIKADVELYLKYEGANPTGSFKDRGMTVAVSKAAEEGAKAVVCASTGNTSASAAAYAAHAGIKAIVILPAGNVALGKLSQAMMTGARVIPIEGNFDQALDLAKEIAEKYAVVLVNSLNPNRIEGQKTGAFEIVDDLGCAPDYQFMPVGNAGNITAYWKGYREYHSLGKCKLPRMMGWQAEGAAPIVRGWAIENPETVATAIRIGNPASWKQAEAARDESGGVIDMLSDDEIVAAYRLVAETEGVFCEPASGASVAGVKRWADAGHFSGGEIVVCILTGHGLKDPELAIAICEKPRTVRPEIVLVAEEAGL